MNAHCYIQDCIKCVIAAYHLNFYGKTVVSVAIEDILSDYKCSADIPFLPPIVLNLEELMFSSVP